MTGPTRAAVRLHPRDPEGTAASQRLLGEAYNAVTDRLQGPLPVTGGLGPEEARAELEIVVVCVRELLGGAVGLNVIERLSRPIVARMLVDELRAEVLARVDSVPRDAEPVLRVLAALESVRGSTDGDEDLKTRLAQPDALELLVEVAHDLRSPLTSILFLAETLRAGFSGEVNETQRSQLGLIYSAALGLVSMSSDVVDLARDGRGLVEGDPQPFFLSEVFQGVEEMVRPMAEEKEVDLRVLATDGARPHGYPIALGRVLLNLTTNALKFTDRGYVELGAQVISGTRIECYVRDTGRGVDEERQKELYQPFKKRVSAEGHFFSGSGVGLSIARRLVRAMGSDLVLETALGWGTRFSFTLDSPSLH